MMGLEVTDPDHVEGDIERLPGLGLLPVATRMQGEKVTRQVRFRQEGKEMESWYKGYEIHMGATRMIEGASADFLNVLEDGTPEGCFAGHTCLGTYIHGILDNPGFIDFLLEPFKERLAQEPETFDYRRFKEQQYDKLAAHVRLHVNMPLIYKILKGEI